MPLKLGGEVVDPLLRNSHATFPKKLIDLWIRR
jgi:hypothetical protein